MAMSETVTGIVWLKSFLYEIGQGRFISTQCVIHVDNRGPMCIAKNNAVSDRSKQGEYLDLRGMK
jgi:hypothetical protein